jgi:sigma-B regulation protein RsbU (phosphoserine phosphatase)
LRSQITRQVRSKILRGDLEDGAVLPPCHSLARQHHVPALAVQQAYDALIAEGLLEADGAGGFRVAALSNARRRQLAQERLYEELQEQGLSLKELELARDIQRRLLPPAHVTGDGYEVAARSFPARFVAGDFYDVLSHPDGSLGVVIADVAGKGFAASLTMASVKAMTPFIAAQHSVEGTLSELNRRLASDLGRGQFVALAYARFQPTSGIVTIANAGIPDPLLVRPCQPVVTIEAPGPRLPLGAWKEVAYESTSCPLVPGDRLLLFTDGIPEARLFGREALGYEALANAVAEVGPGPVPSEVWLDQVLDRIQAVTGPILDDDYTALVLEAQQPARKAGP